MKKISIIVRLVLSVTLVIASIVILRGNGVTTAFAVGDLSVNWGVAQGNPIYVVNTMSPGENQNRVVNVFNGAASSRPVSVRGILDLEVGGLGSILELIIKADGMDIYGGTTGTKTVTQFLTESGGPTGIMLTTLASGADVDYAFDVLFPSSAGNTFQNASIQFDLKIGINIDLPQDCSHIGFSGDPIYGTDGNDRIAGTRGNDLIFALEGNDRVMAYGGDDCIVGGLGNDELRGETGNDSIFGNEGDDLIIGAVGDDQLFGGAGRDTIRGENNNDTLFGEAGDDLLDGGNGNDSLVGGANIDKANGKNGSDSCDAEVEISCEL